MHMAMALANKNFLSIIVIVINLFLSVSSQFIYDETDVFKKSSVPFNSINTTPQNNRSNVCGHNRGQ